MVHKGTNYRLKVHEKIFATQPEISRQKYILKMTIFRTGIDLSRNNILYCERICLVDRKSKTFNISESNFHL